MTMPQEAPNRIEQFCHRFRLTYEKVEENIYNVDQFRLYLPGSNSVDDEALTDHWVYRSITIPGVHTLSNGDPGYPNEYDEEEIGRGSLIDCLEVIGHASITQWCDEERMVETFACEGLAAP